MATVSRLSIMIDANASGVAKGLAPVTKQLGNLKSAVTGAFMGGGAVAATFLTVEKIIGKIKHAFADAARLAKEGFITSKELANVQAMQSAWKNIGDGVSAFILKVSSAVAPTFLVMLDNMRSLLGPMVDVESLMKSFGEWVEWSAAQFANLQAIVSGAFLMWYVAADAFFGKWLLKLEMVKVAMEDLTGQDLFDNDGAVDRINQELQSMLDLFEQGQAMLAEGVDGGPGRALLAQIDAKREELEKSADKSVTEVKEAAVNAQLQQPAALSMGSAAAASAIAAAKRESDGSKKIMLDQLKELRKIAAQKPVVLAPANL